MQDFLTWGAVVAAGGSVVTMIKFWMDMGAAQVKADSAASAAAIVSAKTDLLASSLSSFKVEAAQTYASAKNLESMMQGIYSRLDNMTQRMDSLITIAKGVA